jgi:hypothetical protein
MRIYEIAKVKTGECVSKSTPSPNFVTGPRQYGTFRGNLCSLGWLALVRYLKELLVASLVIRCGRDHCPAWRVMTIGMGAQRLS